MRVRKRKRAEEIHELLDRWTSYIRNHAEWRNKWRYEIILSREDFDVLNKERSTFLKPIDLSEPIHYNGFPVSVSARGVGTRLVKIVADEMEQEVWE